MIYRSGGIYEGSWRNGEKYGKGKKIYLLLKYNIIKNTDLWIKVSETIYDDRDIIRSGWDEIDGNRLTELKIQLRYKF